MKDYVSNLLKTLCVLIILFNIYIMATTLVKIDSPKYSKSNSISYAYDIIVEEIEQPKQEEIKQTEEIKKEQEEIIENNANEYTVLESFIGSMTGYGPDCYGCGGVTSAGHDLRNGNIYYQDKTFGQLRIVAADPKFKFGTVLRVSGLKIYDEPFLAIVLDRGGAIKGEKMDLAFDSESNPLVDQIGYSRNVQYEVLRYGW
jgi:3D (Asp-Asp-Asp) domain-containing protein